VCMLWTKAIKLFYVVVGSLFCIESESEALYRLLWCW